MADLRTRIQLAIGYLDITEDIQVPLNYSIAEIQDISSRQGSYSKTIIVPGTHNNNLIFGNLFDVNIINSTFNQNLRQSCMILQDGIPVFEGYLQLLNVTKLNPTQLNPDEQVIYEVAVKDSVGDFYSILQDKLLTDLQETYFDNFNHIYTFSSITQSWTNSVSDVYKYHSYQTADAGYYHLEDFKPSIFAKIYWDRIFNESGYSYEWDSLSGCSFDKLIIPFNGKVPVVDVKPYQFKAGFNSTTNNGPYFANSTYTLLMRFNNDSTNGYFDNGNNYQNTDGIYTSPYNGEGTFRVKYKIGIYIDSPVACTFKALEAVNNSNQPNGTAAAGALLKITAIHHMGDFASGLPIYEIPLGNEIIYQNTFVETAVGDPIVDSIYNVPAALITVSEFITQEFVGVKDLLIGDRVRNWITARFDAAGKWYYTSTGLPLPNNLIPTLKINIGIDYTTTQHTYFLNEAKATFGEGMTVNLYDFIPKQVKQKDFISSIIKMNNLYITRDDSNDKNLIVRTRDEFYDGGAVLDWTQKLQIDNTIKVQFLPDVQNKKVRFSYELGNNVWDKDYQQQRNEIYGQLEYTFANEFVQGIKEIKPIFASTTIINTFFGVPLAGLDGRNPEGPIRILYDSGFYDLNPWGQYWKFEDPFGNVTSYSGISIATHLDNPYNPTIDINFGLFDNATYQNYEIITNNNLFNKYYSRFFQQIESGKLMTCNMRLNSADINKLDFRDKIWIADAYWFINKIIDYNPNGNGLTQVELISIDDALKFVPVSVSKNDSSIQGINFNNGLMNANSIIHKADYNIVGGESDWVQVLGTGNIVQTSSPKNIIVGDNNNIGGTKNLVMGDNNLVQGTGNAILGRDDITLRGNNLVVAAGSFVQYANKVDAGRNIVLNQFSISKPISIISGGRNLVRGYNSGTLESMLSAGRNSVL